MKRKSLSLFTLLISIFVAGCNQNSNELQSNANKSRVITVYTEAELDKLIIPGMSIEDITNKFGPPGSEVQATENLTLLTYLFPSEIAKHKEGEPYLTGFGVDIKDGRVVRWSPVTGMTGKTIEPGVSQGSFREQFFEIFLVTDSLTNTLKAFDLEGSADTSALKISPNLEFKAKIFAGKNENESSNEITVILVMGDQDASKFKELTENNIGKQTLLVCHNKVIAAPEITMPINSKQFMFTVKDSRALDSLRSK